VWEWEWVWVYGYGYRYTEMTLAPICCYRVMCLAVRQRRLGMGMGTGDRGDREQKLCHCGSSVDFHINKWPRLPLQHPIPEAGLGNRGQSYLLAGVLSIKLWFMQIMRVQKLVCHSHWRVKRGRVEMGTWPRLLWPCCRTESN